MVLAESHKEDCILLLQQQLKKLKYYEIEFHVLGKVEFVMKSI
jgi:hypothetical protein